MEFFRTALAVFTCKWYYLCAYFSPDSDKLFPLEIYIFTAVLLIEVNTHLKAKVLNILTMDLFLSFSPHKMLTDRLELCGFLVDYCDVLISCLDPHSDGTHSLQKIHW